VSQTQQEKYIFGKVLLPEYRLLNKMVAKIMKVILLQLVITGIRNVISASPKRMTPTQQNVLMPTGKNTAV
jgi:hypothetical protein